MKEAAHYSKLEDHSIQCLLCPHSCHLQPGELGKCLVRRNKNGILWAENYGRISAIHLDPVEKKPLYHFYPGYRILSIGTVGCNFSCGFCQNCEISQKSVDEYPSLINFSGEKLAEMALSENGNIGIAYTYNEPVIYFEYVMDIATQVKKAGMKNVMVTNGFIEPGPLDEILEVTDAFNVDLKSFSNEFYRKHTGGRIRPVLKALEMIRAAGKHLELTNLIIPGLNDQPKIFLDMVYWIMDHLGSHTILHLSRYHPDFNYYIQATPERTLHKLFNIAKEHLPFVYLGNIYMSIGNNTICPVCGNILISRSGYDVKITGMNNAPVCDSCQTDLNDYFKF